jgi:hypothetical protein
MTELCFAGVLLLCVRAIWRLCFWLASKNVCALNAELAGGLLFGGVAETIEVLGYSHGFQTRTGQRGHELCLRQSAGDSSGPQVDVAPNVFGERRPHDDVGEL